MDIMVFYTQNVKFEMKIIEYNLEKDKLLQEKYGVGFEDIIKARNGNRIIANIKHPNKVKYLHQRMMFVEIKDYIYAVPYIMDEEKIFLKTIYPSRKYTKIFQSERKKHE
jgi:hypothetical protein